MEENHSQKMTENKLDQLARTIVQSAVLSGEEIEEIANAPELWRATRNRLDVEKERRERHWFFGWRWQWASVAAFAFLIAACAALWKIRQTTAEITDVTNEKINVVSTIALNEKPIEFETNSETSTSSDLPTIPPKTSFPETKNHKAENAEPKAKMPRVQFAFQPQRAALTASKSKSVRAIAGNQSEKENVNSQIKSAAKTATEAATEFIALSYLPASESGQIVRVKVPRSMMVSLGVTTKTEKNSELVNAEVVVGDDGAARAIRFLANE